MCSRVSLWLYFTTPWQIFHSSKEAHPDPVTYTSPLKSYMQQLWPPPVSVKHIKQSFIQNNLSTCTHVFIRHDAVKKPLQQLYDGPFKVLERSDKHFTLQVKGKDSIVSIDQLKPAFLDEQVDDTLRTPQSIDESITLPPAATSPPPQVTRSGRHAHWPKKLVTDAFTGSLEGE